jgi:CheY-like chemotaxis protein
MSQRTVLVVEDNEDNRIILTTYLDHHGWRVVEAADGALGVEAARTELPDIVLMDVSLPTMDGWTATSILKADPTTERIPIIALTAHALATDRRRAVEAGCDSYLAKPIDPKEVIAEIERLLAARTGEESAHTGASPPA